MSQNEKATHIVYGGYEPKRDRDTVYTLAVVAMVFWTLALATLFGWILSWL